MTGPQVKWLPDHRRLHMNHGPIDLIVEAFGEEVEVHAAYRQAAARFRTILQELVDELPELRRRARRFARSFAGIAAQHMENAVVPLVTPAGHGHSASTDRFITPMAAVAGAVADEMLAAMIEGRSLDRAYVNDGGDIAVYLAPGAEMNAAIAGTVHGLEDRVTIRSADTVRGIATSGWRGRSFSLGIADAVTVLARTAAEADAAAAIIANAVDLPGHPAVERRPADELAPDSDLGSRLVTINVGPLSTIDRATALRAGLATAEELRQRGLIEGAALFLGEDVRICGDLPGRVSARHRGLRATRRRPYLESACP